MKNFLKKTFKFLMGRFFITSLMLLVQIVFLMLVLLYLGNISIAFFVIVELISILTALVILNDNLNPSYKISFILLVLLLPIVGVTFYYIFGRITRSKRVKRIVDEKRIVTDKLLEKDNEAIIFENDDEDFKKISRMITKDTGMGVSKNTETKLLTPGEVKFEYLKEELSKAKKFILMEYFIIEPGIMWNSILEILTAKVQEGIEVRVMYDDFGCVSKVPLTFESQLKKRGILVKAFNPYQPRLAGIMNYRDHRKICVIDGDVGFLGGINLADEYINAIDRFGHWKDTSVMIKGDGVFNLTVLFFDLWNGKETIKNIDPYRPTYDSKVKSSGYVQVFGDSAFDKSTITENVYISMINNAKKYCYITSPYLIIDNEMLTALKNAAKSGVDVRLIVPHVPDKKIVFWVTQSYFKELTQAGVKVYEYLPGFLHAKTIVSDGCHAMVGTANLDYRSLYLHFEVSCYMYKTKATRELEKDFEECLKVSKLITLENCPKTGIFKGLVLFILKAFTPMM